MRIFKLNYWFFLPYSLALVLGAALLFQLDKGELLLVINRNHTPFFDCLFYYGTSLGNGLFYALVILLLACFNYGFAFIGTVSFTATGLMVAFLKRVVFSGIVRPKLYFAGTEDLHFVEGVKILSHHSFPSGHTAVAFSLFCLLAILVSNNKWGLIFILAALIGGLSRIYLVQHFFVDVYFGSILGVVVTVVSCLAIKKSKWYETASWPEKSLFTFRDKG